VAVYKVKRGKGKEKEKEILVYIFCGGMGVSFPLFG
jgi:hypothetical protein